LIRAVIFDIGGPIDTEEKFEAAIDADIRAGLEREGFSVTDAAWAAAHRQAIETCAPSVYRSVIWRLSDNNIAESLRIYDWVEARAAERDIFELRPGVVDVLERLKQRCVKLGLAANQPMKALRQMEEHGIKHYFENDGISGVYGYRKPDVRLFLRTCKDLAVEPADCIMVGDRIDNDVVPAKLLGMRTVLFCTGRHRDQQPRSWDEIPDFEVDNVAGLQLALTKLLDAPSDENR
jgi:HAD superfamily hydrolase (TIGR01549 family)